MHVKVSLLFFIALYVFCKQYWVPIVSIKRNVQFQVYSSMDSTENHRELVPHLRDHCYSKLQRAGTLIPLCKTQMTSAWLGVNCGHSVEQVEGSCVKNSANQ